MAGDAAAGGAGWPSVTRTVSPCATRLPACGFCAMTNPEERTTAAVGLAVSAELALGVAVAAVGGAAVVTAAGGAACVTTIMRNPALAARALAAEALNPTSDGIAYSFGCALSGTESLTSRLTRGPSTPLALRGESATALRRGRHQYQMRHHTQLQREPPMPTVAARSVCPFRSGICTRCAPSDSVMRTGHSRRTREPATGSCARMRPTGMSTRRTCSLKSD